MFGGGGAVVMMMEVIALVVFGVQSSRLELVFSVRCSVFGVDVGVRC